MMYTEKFECLAILTRMSVARTAFLMAIGAGDVDLGWSLVMRTRTMFIKNISEHINTIMTGITRINW